MDNHTEKHAKNSSDHGQGDGGKAGTGIPLGGQDSVDEIGALKSNRDTNGNGFIDRNGKDTDSMKIKSSDTLDGPESISVKTTNQTADVLVQKDCSRVIGEGGTDISDGEAHQMKISDCNQVGKNSKNSEATNIDNISATFNSAQTRDACNENVESGNFKNIIGAETPDKLRRDDGGESSLLDANVQKEFHEQNRISENKSDDVSDVNYQITETELLKRHDSSNTINSSHSKYNAEQTASKTQDFDCNTIKADEITKVKKTKVKNVSVQGDPKNEKVMRVSVASSNTQAMCNTANNEITSIPQVGIACATKQSPQVSPSIAVTPAEEQDRLDAALALASIINVATPPTTPVSSAHHSPSFPISEVKVTHKPTSKQTIKITSERTVEYVPTQQSPNLPMFGKGKKSPKLSVTETSIPKSTETDALKKRAKRPNKAVKKKGDTRKGLPQAICLPKGALVLNHHTAHATSESIQSTATKHINVGTAPKPTSLQQSVVVSTCSQTQISPTSKTSQVPSSTGTTFHQHLILSHMMKSPSFVQHYQNVLMLQNAHQQEKSPNNMSPKKKIQPIIVAPVNSLGSPSPRNDPPPLEPIAALDLTTTSKEQDEPLDLKVRKFPSPDSAASVTSSPAASPVHPLHLGNPQVATTISSAMRPKRDSPPPRFLRTSTNVGLLEVASGSLRPVAKTTTEHQPRLHLEAKSSSSFSTKSNDQLIQKKEEELVTETDLTYQKHVKTLPPKKRKIYGIEESPAKQKKTVSRLEQVVSQLSNRTSRTASHAGQIASPLVREVASLDSSMLGDSTSKSTRPLHRSASQGDLQEISVEETTHGKTPVMVVPRDVASLPVRLSADRTETPSLPIVTPSLPARGAHTSVSTAAAAGQQHSSLHPELNTVLLKHGQMAVQPDEDGDLPIHIAVVQNEMEVVDRLISFMIVSKLSLDFQNNLRQTPLHLAIIVEQPILVHKLLQGGSNPNIPDRRGMTGFHLAIKHRNVTILKLLLKSSKCPLRLDTKNYEGMTALHMAVLVGSADMVALLLEAGCNLDIQDGKSGRTAVFHAAETNQYRIASILLQHGATVNISSYSGSTPVAAANGRGRSEMTALLIKYGAETSSGGRDAADAGSSGGRNSDSRGGGGPIRGRAARGKARGGESVRQILRNNLASKPKDSTRDLSPMELETSQATDNLALNLASTASVIPPTVKPIQIPAPSEAMTTNISQQTITSENVERTPSDRDMDVSMTESS